jgi:hypothetical protein
LRSFSISRPSAARPRKDSAAAAIIIKKEDEAEAPPAKPRRGRGKAAAKEAVELQQEVDRCDATAPNAVPMTEKPTKRARKATTTRKAKRKEPAQQQDEEVVAASKKPKSSAKKKSTKEQSQELSEEIKPYLPASEVIGADEESHIGDEDERLHASTAKRHLDMSFKAVADGEPQYDDDEDAMPEGDLEQELSDARITAVGIAIGIPERKVKAALQLRLVQGNTVPFIARYRQVLKHN